MPEPVEGDDESSAGPLATVASGGALIASSKVLSLGFGFITQLVMARLLTEATYGKVVLTLSVINIAGIVAMAGLDDGIMRELPHYEDTPAKAIGVIRAGLGISAVSSTLVSLVIYFGAPYISSTIFQDPSLIPLIKIGSIGIPFVVLGNISVSLARGARNARVEAYVGQLFQPTARFLFIGALIFSGFQAAGAVAGHTIANIFAAVLALYLAFNTIPGFWSPSERMYRSLLIFSLPLIAVQGLGFLNSNIDIYMIGYLLQSTNLGIYNISLQLGSILTSIVVGVGFLLPPVLTRLDAQGDNIKMQRTFQILTKWLVLIGIPIFVVLFFAPEFVIGLLFGKQYEAGALALQILLIGKFFGLITGLNKQALIGLGKNKVLSYIVLLQTLLNGLIDLALIPQIGIEGAAIGIVASIVVGDTLGIMILHREFGLHPFKKAILWPVIAVFSVASCSYALLWIIGLPTEAVILFVAVAYLPIVASFAVESEDIELLVRFEKEIGYDLTVVRKIFRSINQS